MTGTAGAVNGDGEELGGGSGEMSAGRPHRAQRAAQVDALHLDRNQTSLGQVASHRELAEDGRAGPRDDRAPHGCRRAQFQQRTGLDM